MLYIFFVSKISIKQIVKHIWSILNADVNLLARHYIICNIFIGQLKGATSMGSRGRKEVQSGVQCN